MEIAKEFWKGERRKLYEESVCCCLPYDLCDETEKCGNIIQKKTLFSAMLLGEVKKEALPCTCYCIMSLLIVAVVM